ncbi:MAG: hypothetical protein GX448_17165 [Planctomycetes bacterium]|nr:hypothetical protein [Planctomycetota bacterium]
MNATMLPMAVISMTFLFVLLVILLTKAPKVGVGLIVAIVAMVGVGLLVGVFVIVPGRPQMAIYGSQTHQQFAHGPATTGVGGDMEGAYGGAHAPLTVPSTSILPRISSEPLSPIWSEGVEQEFEADVYPSSLAAAKALGRRMADPIRTVAGDPNAAVKVILFQENNERSLIAAFGRSLEQALPGVRCSIEADLRNVHPGEVGLTLRFDGMLRVQEEGLDLVLPRDKIRVLATAFTEARRTTAEADYVDKPWVDSFGAYASARPNESLIIARSSGTCTSESEANQQALDDVRARLTEALGRQTGRSLADLGRPPISTRDVLDGGFVVDRFVQSFDTATGKVWRQAMLIDVSGPKLARLANVQTHQARETRMTWARMGLSSVGVLLLIGVIYFFLNMATRGYYEWSLRIAGAVLAVVAIVAILMIVQ